jgi:hypothetical protein
VDIVYRTNEGKLVSVDIKTYNCNNQEKMNFEEKLRLNYPFCEARIVSVLNGKVFNFSLVSNIEPCSQMKKDFNTVDQLLRDYDCHKFGDTKIILDLASEIGQIPETHNYFKVPKIVDFQHMDDTFINELVTRNSVTTAKWFDETMRISKLKESTIQHHYGLDFYSNLCSMSFKSFVKIPIIHKSKPLSHDFAIAARELIEIHISLGTQVPYLTRLLSLCTDDIYHPNGELEELVLSKSYDYNLYKKCRAKRVRGTIKTLDGSIQRDLINRVKILNLDVLDSKFLEMSGRREDVVSSLNTESLLIESLKKLSESKINDHTSSSIVKHFVNLTMIDSGKAGELTRNVMLNSLHHIENKLFSSLLASHQEFTHSLTASWLKQTKTSSSSKFMFNVDNFSDRLGLILSNDTGPASKMTMKSCIILGDVDTQSIIPHISSSVLSGRTNWFTFSASNMEWFSTIYYKAISHFSSILEHNITIKSFITDETIDHICQSKLSFLSTIMMLNSNKFAQCSEQARYLFVNSTGISIGCGELFDKMKWYRPNTLIEFVYMFRLQKMANLLQGLNSSSLLGKALSTVKVSPSVHNISDITTKEWNVCFPHESESTVSDQNCFNSMYICKTFSVNRYQKNTI